MGNYRQTPLKQKDTLKDVTFGDFTYSCSSMCGWRIYMEDAHITQHQLISSNNPNQQVSLFAIFDGHGGPQVAIFVKRHFVQQLLSSSDFKKKDYQAALRQTFFKMDELIKTQKGKQQIIKIHQENFEKGNASNKYQGAGTTANVILMTSNEIYCANAGDARSVAFINGNLQALSQDHKPTDQKQQQRIKAAGGIVHNGRVNGVLAVSRAIGDLQQKDDDKKPSQQAVTANPDIKKFSRQGFEFIIMGCDGLWQVHDNKYTVDWIKDKLNENKQKQLGKILEELLQDTCAKEGQPSQYGKDNISTILIRFNKQFKQKKENADNKKVCSSQIHQNNKEKIESKLWKTQIHH